MDPVPHSQCGFHSSLCCCRCCWAVANHDFVEAYACQSLLVQYPFWGCLLSSSVHAMVHLWTWFLWELVADLSSLYVLPVVFTQFLMLLIPVIIQKSYAIFQKYEDKLMSTFNRYTFEDTFPDATILTWCVLGALDWMCRVSLSAFRQSVVSQSWQNHRQRNQKTLSVNWLKEKAMLFAKHVINQ